MESCCDSVVAAGVSVGWVMAFLAGWIAGSKLAWAFAQFLQPALQAVEALKNAVIERKKNTQKVIGETPIPNPTFVTTLGSA